MATSSSRDEEGAWETSGMAKRPSPRRIWQEWGRAPSFLAKRPVPPRYARGRQRSRSGKRGEIVRNFGFRRGGADGRAGRGTDADPGGRVGDDRQDVHGRRAADAGDLPQGVPEGG